MSSAATTSQATSCRHAAWGGAGEAAGRRPSLRSSSKHSADGLVLLQQQPLRALRQRSSRSGARAEAAAINVAAVESKPAAGKKKASDVDWDNIGFGLVPPDYMFVGQCELGGDWSGQLQPYGNISISPSAGVLNYGQGVFEGLKSYRTADGRVVTFRPTQNARRMQYGAKRMSMPPPPEDFFVDAVLRTISANRDWIPPYGKGSLYVRPLLIGSGAVLGLAPAPSYTLLVFASPVGPYFKGGQQTPISLQVCNDYHRAAANGQGDVKTMGNYAQVLAIQQKAKAAGFADVLYLDDKENKYLEEVSSCNIFVVKGKRLATPCLGTILDGITRRSILQLASDLGYEAVEEKVTVDDLFDAEEVFCTGTAVVVSPVGSVTYGERRAVYHNGEVGPVAAQLYKALTDLQFGRTKDTYNWLMEVPEGYHNRQ
eukprot:jgi/Chlat1/7337/Chrsp59S06967